MGKPRAMTPLAMLVDALHMDLRAERRIRLKADTPLV